MRRTRERGRVISPARIRHIDEARTGREDIVTRIALPRRHKCLIAVGNRAAHHRQEMRADEPIFGRDEKELRTPHRLSVFHALAVAASAARPSWPAKPKRWRKRAGSTARLSRSKRGAN